VGRKLKEAEIEERISDLASRGITVLGKEYRGMKGLCFDVQCRCGHKWLNKASQFVDYGCYQCGVVNRIGPRLSEKKIQTRIDDLSRRGIEVLGKEYRNGELEFDVRCHCGNEWSNPSWIFKNHGCRKCSDKAKGLLFRYSNADLDLIRSDLLSRGITPLKSEYKSGDCYFTVRCGCGHKWTTLASIFKNQKSGCVKCAGRGFDPEKPGIVYYVRFGCLYKIGITNRTVRERFKNESLKPEIIQIWHFKKGSYAYEFEQKVIRKNAFDLYHGLPILRTVANDEFFVRDVLGLDGAKRVQQELQLVA
jgi:hypothetical protein